MKLKTALLLSSVVSAGILLSGNMALAGFEWTPPTQPKPELMDELAPHPMAEPVPEEDMGLVPAMDEDLSGPMQPEAEVLAPPGPVIQEPEKMVLGEEPLSVVPPPMQQFQNPQHVLKAPEPRAHYKPSVSSSHTSQTEQSVPVMDQPINGFGKDVPLVTAIRQLLPESYSYKFAPDVDLGRKVSWDGGQTLGETLENILASGGYTYSTQGDTVFITSIYPKESKTLVPSQDIPGFDDMIRANLVLDQENKIEAPRPLDQESSLSVSPPPQLEFPAERQTYIQPVSSPVSLSIQGRDVIMQPQHDDMMTPLMAEALAQPSANNIDESAFPAVSPPPSVTSSPTAVYHPVSLSSFPDLQKERTWNVKRNSDLRATLANWTSQVGVGLQWNAEQSYSVDYMVWVDGTFEDALSVLMKGYENKTGPVPAARFDLQQGQQPVLVIDTVTR